MSNKGKRLGKGLKRDYRKSLIGKATQTSKSSNVQIFKNLETKKSRMQTTIYLTKEQFRAIKEIQLQLLDDDFKIENSQIAGLGIEILKQILKSPDIQKSKNLETLKSKCLDILRKSPNT